MHKECKKEILSVCNFLKLQKDINDVSVDLHDRKVIFSINTEGSHEDRDSNVVYDIFAEYFLKKFGQKLIFQYSEKWEIDSIDVKSLDHGQAKKDIINQIVMYDTNRHDWRLFRYETERLPDFDENYFLPSEKIASVEVANLDKVFTKVLEDMAARKFVRTIIELNINCINEEDLQKKYIFAFRQLPKQLRNRFALSLVRIDPQISFLELKKAIALSKHCTDNIFFSFSFDTILSKDILKQLRGITGYIVTVNTDKFKSANDIQKVYEKIDTLLDAKSVFLIFEGKQKSEQVFLNRNIRIFEKASQVTLQS